MIDHHLPAVSEHDYSYWVPEIIYANRCHTERLKRPLWYVSAFAFVGEPRSLKNSEDALARALVAHGPLAIGLNANGMQFYWRGVQDARNSIFGCDPKQIDHGVTLVGYGVDAAKPFWTIKNSWGTWWGERGYYRLLRGQGVCGVQSLVVTATEVEAAGERELKEEEVHV